MFSFILRRTIYAIPIVFGIALIVFVLFNLVGGDPVYQMLGKHATQEMVDQLRRELGLDRSLFAQFIDYLRQIATFDFGRSYATKETISDMILRGLGPTLSLTIVGFVVSLVLSLGIALAVSYKHGKWIDRVVVLLCVIGMSVPALAYILFGQYILAYQMGWFPISGYSQEWPDRLSYIALPALIWVFVSVGIDVRYFRTSILDETRQDYVRTARAKGLSEKMIFLKHIFKNSMIPILTFVVMEIPFLVMGSFLLESFFGIPGIGSIMIDAINNSDFPVLKAMTTVISILYVMFNLFSDLLYTWVDPRVKLR